MKHLFLSLTVVLTTVISSLDASAQVYSKMPEKKRNAALIKVARKFYKEPKFKYFYKTYGEKGTPSVRTFNADMVPPYYSNYKELKEQMGQKTYEVTFYMNTTTPGNLSSARVYVSDKAGIPYKIVFATNDVVNIWDDWYKE